MKKMKSIILIMILCIFSLAGCSIQESQNNNYKIKIISTNFPGYDFTKAIGDDLVDVSILIPPGAETHSYEPSPQDIINIQNSDLFIYTGGESDAWVDDILESMDKPVNTLKMIDYVSLLESDEEHNHEDDHSNISDYDHEHSEYDEHVWTSPKNAMKISKSIEEALSKIDQDNNSIYQDNLNNYVTQLEKLDSDFTNFFNSVENKILVFGDRFPFKYFAKDYNLEYYAAYNGCSTDIEPSVSTIASLIDIVKQENISTIFYIEFSNHKVADSIAEATDAKIALFHSCHNVSKEELNNNVTYISLMENNLKTLREVMK
ncbi:MAG: metal ABC transporter substrate-binding protein [Peptostreptococcaceae bacterium]